MKKINFLLVLCCFWLTSFSQQGALTIYSSNNQRFWLFVDDILQNEYSVSSIQIQRMQLQSYKIRVEIDNLASNCIGQLITISNQQSRNSYLVSYRNNGYFISSGQTNIRPELVLNLIQPNYNYYNDYFQYMYPGFGNHGNYWQGSGGGNQGKPYQYSHRPNSGSHQGGSPKPPSVSPPSHGHGQPGGGYGNTQTSCRNSSEFAMAIASIKKETFESGKLQFAKNMTVSGPICVEQIIQICNMFTYESSKLEYAKFAYPYCSDKNLYYLVNNVFQYQSSKNELNKIIGY